MPRRETAWSSDVITSASRIATVRSSKYGVRTGARPTSCDGLTTVASATSFPAPMPSCSASSTISAPDATLEPGRSYEAILCTWERVAPSGATALRNRIEALCPAGVHVGVFATAPAEVVDGALRARPDGPGTLHLLTDRGTRISACTRTGTTLVHVVEAASSMAAAARWLAALLCAHGIGPGLIVLIGGDLASLVDDDVSTPVAAPELRRAAVTGRDTTTTSSSGPSDGAVLLRVADEQLRRRSDRRVPHIDPAPGWVIELPAPTHPADVGVQATLLTLADGRFGSRGCIEHRAADAAAAVVASGVYTDVEDRRTLLSAPVWDALDDVGTSAVVHRLDLRTGVVEGASDEGFRSLRFASCVRSGVMAVRAEAPAGITAGDALWPCDRGAGDDCVTVARSTRGGGVVAAARQHHAGTPVTRVERLAGYAAHPRRVPDAAEARDVLERAERDGFDRLLAEQRTEWARRWADAAVTIQGDDGAQLAARFALFHVLSTVADSGEAAVGARGLSGVAYDGHVFWDADVFVLPVLAATRPRAARAMLEYRLARLAAARRRAASHGFDGALWPWESADDGADVTPQVWRDRSGTPVPIRTGAAEHHIVADVAWAAHHFAQWTGDVAFLGGVGRPLVLDSARFWASRVDVDDAGRAHIRGVIGPDEYHELVDDNAFTNVMARWNLRAAADLAEAGDAAPSNEIARWRHIADALVDGYDTRTGRHEQFAGFYGLTPLIIAEIARPPVAADLLLGRDVVQASQVVKQADVVMLHHLVPDLVAPGSLQADLEYYAPRTAHGSSLSPAIHAAAWARAGRPDRALDLLHVALRLDLDDVTGTTGGGLHVATLGSVWQALAFGFLGLRPLGDALLVDPVLPATWDALELTVRFRGGRVVVHASHHELRLTCERPLTVQLGTPGQRITVRPPGRNLPVPVRSREVEA
jgi:trehalose/maltose hydrolase-like predicted phosphorylase